MRADCPDCEAFRRERATQISTGTGDLGDLLTRVALHESTTHRKPPRCHVPLVPEQKEIS